MGSAGAPVPPDMTKICMEQFGFAYVEAVASVVGCAVDTPTLDIQSEDLILRQPAEGERPAHRALAVQVKTNAGGVVTNDQFSYALGVKNYSDLCVPRSELTYPRILVVVRVPDDLGDWLEQSDQELVVRHCAYWVSLEGREEPDTSSTKTVRIPRKQRFNASSLNEIMASLGGGGAE